MCPNDCGGTKGNTVLGRGWGGGWGRRKGGAVRRAASGDTVARTQRRDSDIQYTLPRPVKCRLLHYRHHNNSSSNNKYNISTWRIEGLFQLIERLFNWFSGVYFFLRVTSFIFYLWRKKILLVTKCVQWT